MAEVVNEANFSEKVLEPVDMVVIVDFYTDWCGPCKTMSPVLDDLGAEGVGVYKVDIEQSASLGTQYNVNKVPTIMAFYNGEAVQRIEGIHPLEKLQAMVYEASK